MAESAVSLVIGKLVPLLTQEATLLEGIHKEVADIKDELESIHAFLKDAESKAEKEGIGQGAKVWVKQVKEVAYDIEDAIDEYILHVTQDLDRHGCAAFLHRIAFLVKKLKPRHQIASKIRDIKASLQEIKSRCERYQFISSEEGASISNRLVILNDPRPGCLFIEEAELVGIESPRDDLISYLVSGTAQSIVIAVVGMGGVGKTTLVKKVYDNHRIKEKFQCHAWITVSQSYDKKEMLRSVLKKFYEAQNEPFPKSIVAMDELSLIKELNEYLQHECYLVVFDDVWETSFWRVVELGLLNNNKGSRILITTRNRDVADFCRISPLDHVHQMETLPQEEAWELFCKKAFKFVVGKQCPKELVELSQDIVRKCEGLPLAIVVIGGLLATKERSTATWRKFLNNLRFALVSDPQLESVTKILSLSYSDLPNQLKPCFLYFSMFPEDFSIKRRRLIQLWMACGFVQNRQGMTLEEVALEYLTELIHRSLVQVHDVSCAGVPITYRVHDLVRDISLSKSGELSVSFVSRNCSIIKGMGRHLSINDKERYDPSKSSNTRSQTRSIILFNNRAGPPVRIIDAIFSKCKLLTTLDFENCLLDHIPEELGDLLHLRCLSLRNTNVSKLPKSIKKLHNLETLDLKHSLVDDLPVEINTLLKLQNLLGGHRETYVLKIHGSIRQLEFLQTLWRIRVDDEHHGVRLIDELGMLKRSRKLGITKLKREHGGRLCNALEKMTHLRSLLVSSINWDEFLEVQSMSSPPLHLQSLRLVGPLETLPNWISNLGNLTKLGLTYSRLMDDSIKILEALPSLVYLSLLRAYSGDKMRFEGKGFQKLIRLDLEGLDGLNEMTIDRGALPLLEFLRIGVCPQLKEVPFGIQHLKNLRELSFAGMTAEFTKKLSSQNEGEDYWKVKHVPYLHYDGTYDPDDQSSYAAYVKRWFGWITNVHALES